MTTPHAFSASSHLVLRHVLLSFDRFDSSASDVASKLKRKGTAKPKFIANECVFLSLQLLVLLIIAVMAIKG